MHQHGEDTASESHEAGTDANLAFQGNRTTTADDRQPGLIPGKRTAFDIDDVHAAGGLQFFARLSAAAAGAADDVDWIRARVLCQYVAGAEGFQREIDGCGSVDFAEFGGSPDIDEPNLAAGFDGIVQFFGSDCGDAHV